MKYELHVWCSKDGLTRDAGIEKTGEYKNDEDAKNDLRTALPALWKRYDEVVWSIVDANGRKVC